MDKSRALLCIVIPTRNRQDTLVQVVGVLLEDLPEEVEILISDNASVPAVQTLLPTHPRLRVIRSEERMSMPAHWRFALRHVSAHYFTVMGDDDLINKKRLLQTIPILHGGNFELIHWHRGAYFWSSFRGANAAGNLMIYNGDSAHTLSCKDLLEKHFCKIGDYQHLPSVYNSIISSDSASKRLGSLVNLIPEDCLSPDVASSLNICDRFDSTLYCNFPISVSGISRLSNGMNPSLHKLFFEDFKELVYKPEKVSASLFPLTTEGNSMKCLFHDYCCAMPNSAHDIDVDNIPDIFSRMLAWYFASCQISLSRAVLLSLVQKGYLSYEFSAPNPHETPSFPSSVLPIPENFINVKLSGIDPDFEAKQVSLFLDSQVNSGIRICA